ncbi:MAG: beta-galactosidase, partial [Verrucomicrobia bacterium]|nr:beta-galactosidase [Verrucomicrobiota bacterium]
PQTWRYTFAKPGEDWTKPGFDDSAWKKGPGGFGTKGTPGAIVRTVWNGPEIWIRRRFTLSKNFPKDHLFLRIHHDEDAEVYVNGKRIGRFPGYVGDYDLYPAQKALEKALRPGENVLAAHCRQTGGGQYIDVGIVRVIERR